MRKTYPQPPPATRDRLLDKLSATNDRAKSAPCQLSWAQLHVEINHLLDWIVGR